MRDIGLPGCAWKYVIIYPIADCRRRFLAWGVWAQRVRGSKNRLYSRLRSPCGWQTPAARRAREHAHPEPLFSLRRAGRDSPQSRTHPPMSASEGRGIKARCGPESTSQVPICKTATTTDWRARRGEACLVPALKSYRPDLQAEPFDAGPRRAFIPRPGPCLLPILALLKIQRRPDPLLADHLQLQPGLGELEKSLPVLAQLLLVDLEAEPRPPKRR